jgi:hypothetical protein
LRIREIDVPQSFGTADRIRDDSFHTCR